MPTVNIAALDSAQGIGFADALISRVDDGAIALGNMVFNVDQAIGAGQDNYVMTYDNATGEISLEAAAGGFVEADLDNIDNAQAIGWADTLFNRIAADEVSPPKLVDMPLGSNTSPSIRPTGSSSSGLFWTSATNLSVSVSGAERFRFGSAGMMATSGGCGLGPTTANPGGVMYCAVAGIIQVAGITTFASGATFEMIEMTPPGTPAANRFRIYAKDNGSGKTQAVILMPDGIETVLATET